MKSRRPSAQVPPGLRGYLFPARRIAGSHYNVPPRSLIPVRVASQLSDYVEGYTQPRSIDGDMCYGNCADGDGLGFSIGGLVKGIGKGIGKAAKAVGKGAKAVGKGAVTVAKKAAPIIGTVAPAAAALIPGGGLVAKIARTAVGGAGGLLREATDKRPGIRPGVIAAEAGAGFVIGEAAQRIRSGKGIAGIGRSKSEQEKVAARREAVTARRQQEQEAKATAAAKKAEEAGRKKAEARAKREAAEQAKAEARAKKQDALAQRKAQKAEDDARKAESDSQRFDDLAAKLKEVAASVGTGGGMLPMPSGGGGGGGGPAPYAAAAPESPETVQAGVMPEGLAKVLPFALIGVVAFLAFNKKGR